MTAPRLRRLTACYDVLRAVYRVTRRHGAGRARAAAHALTHPLLRTQLRYALRDA